MELKQRLQETWAFVLTFVLIWNAVYNLEIYNAYTEKDPEL